MAIHYFIPIELLDTIRDIVNDFNGFVCIRPVEPPFEEGLVIARNPTGIFGQSGELFISANALGFYLEGDLALHGFHQQALDLDCRAFNTSEEYQNYIAYLI